LGAGKTVLEELIGPVVYDEGIPEAKGRSLAYYSIIRVPIYLTDVELLRFPKIGLPMERRFRLRSRSTEGNASGVCDHPASSGY
jgi:hypothetical protein